MSKWAPASCWAARTAPSWRRVPRSAPSFCESFRWAPVESTESMAATEAKRVGVIGAGMVGVCAASWLQRDGHSVFLVETGEPGHGASFGNAGCLNGSSVTPVSMPGVIRKVPRWLLDPLGPLSLRWSYLPAIAPWLVRFIRAGSTPDKVRAQARALRPLVGTTLEALSPLVAAAGAEDLVHRLGHLYVYRSAESLEKDRLAWDLRRENGVETDEFDADELRQLEPALSRESEPSRAGGRERIEVRFGRRPVPRARRERS